MEEVDPLELVMQLSDRIDELDLNISILKDQVNVGKLKLKDFEDQRKKIESEKSDLKKRIYYIKRGMSEKKRTILDEFNQIIESFQVHYDNSAIYKISVFFHYGINKYFEVKVDFEEYPRLPKIEIPVEMEKMIGGINKLEKVSNYKISNPFHVKEILDEISSKIGKLTIINNEIEKIKQNFVTEELEEDYKIRVILWSMGEEYPLILNLRNFPNKPDIILTQKLMKYVNLQDLNTIQKWSSQEASIINILNEISFILDKKFRVEIELKDLRSAGFNATYGSVSDLISLQVAATKKSPQAIFSIKIPSNYPTSPPDIILTNSLNDIAIENAINGLINEAITQHEINLTDLFMEIKELLVTHSKEVCAYCKKLKCPICDKDLVGKIEGVSGEYECNTRCPSCGSSFHICCWKEISTNRQECSVCGSHIRIF
ncbi:MAG: E3 ubiquitin-protein ligase [Candidatus Lokiarchaeota archaeon]|nr:E3 ubiquitin-protein ligase [Candidatus Lokiarchaeota archaeon]